MANGTFQNLIICIVLVLLGVVGLIGAIFFGAIWHLIIGFGALLFAWVVFTDNDYGVESVKHYLQNKK